VTPDLPICCRSKLPRLPSDLSQGPARVTARRPWRQYWVYIRVADTNLSRLPTGGCRYRRAQALLVWTSVCEMWLIAISAHGSNRRRREQLGGAGRRLVHLDQMLGINIGSAPIIRTKQPSAYYYCTASTHRRQYSAPDAQFSNRRLGTVTAQ
jgi:hypothetical protein